MADRLTADKGGYEKFKLGKFLFVFLIIIISDSPIFMYTTNKLISVFKLYFILGLPCILIIIYFLKYGAKINKKIFLLCYLLVGNILATTLITGDSINAGLTMSAKVITALLIPWLWTYEDFQKYFIRVMRIVAVVSLTMYVIYQANPSIVQLLPQVEVLTSDLQSRQTLGTLLFSNVYINAQSTWTIRNFGPFWEPGAFATYLNFVLFLILFKTGNYKGKIFDIVLFIVCVVSTVSTGGIFATTFLFAIYLFEKSDKKKGKIIKSIILIAMLASFLYVNSNSDYMALFEDRIGNMSNGSTYSRIYSVFGNILIFLNSPIWGNGIQSVDSALANYYYSIGGLGVIHNTNTILIYFSSLGIIVGSCLARMWYKFSTTGHKNIFFKVLIFSFVFVMLSNQDFTGSLFFTIVPMYTLYVFKENKHEYLMD